MRRKIHWILISLLLLLSAVTAPVVNAGNSTTATSNCSVSKHEVRVLKSNTGVCVKSNLKNNHLILTVSNPSGYYIRDSGILIKVDGVHFHKELFNIHSGDKFQRRLNIQQGLTVLSDNHTVRISTFGDSTTYNFTEKINAAATTNVPTPYISNVTVADGTIDGKPSSVAYVTIVNPSMRRYSTKLFVHTLGTDGSFYAPSPQPHNSTTIKVELLDKQDTKIAGEVRLYTGNLTKKSGGLDQVGFAGKADKGTNQWNETFEPVRPTWMNNHYHYTNDSYSQGPAEKLSGNHDVDGVPIVYFTPVLFIGVLFVWRRR